MPGHQNIQKKTRKLLIHSSSHVPPGAAQVESELQRVDALLTKFVQGDDEAKEGLKAGNPRKIT